MCETVPETSRGKSVHEQEKKTSNKTPSISIIRRRIRRRPHQRTRHHAPWRPIPPQLRHPGRHVFPKPTHALPCLPVLRDLEPEIIRVQDVVDGVPTQIRLGPLDGDGDIEGFLVDVRIAGTGVADEVALVPLSEAAEAGDERETDFAAECVEVEIEVVKCREQVRGVQGRSNRVLQIIGLACVSVGKVAHVALKTAVTDQGF